MFLPPRFMCWTPNLHSGNRRWEGATSGGQSFLMISALWKTLESLLVLPPSVNSASSLTFDFLVSRSVSSAGCFWKLLAMVFHCSASKGLWQSLTIPCYLQNPHNLTDPCTTPALNPIAVLPYACVFHTCALWILTAVLCYFALNNSTNVKKNIKKKALHTYLHSYC